MAVMAVVTYLIRALPLSVFKREITSRRLRSFLKYIPYAVLSAMTFPAIISSTRSPISAGIGLAAAAVTSYLGGGLLITAISASAAVFIAEFFI
jgi:branched-subunit amino acid transport protein